MSPIGVAFKNLGQVVNKYLNEIETKYFSMMPLAVAVLGLNTYYHMQQTPQPPRVPEQYYELTRAEIKLENARNPIKRYPIEIEIARSRWAPRNPHVAELESRIQELRSIPEVQAYLQQQNHYESRLRMHKEKSYILAFEAFAALLVSLISLSDSRRK